LMLFVFLGMVMAVLLHVVHDVSGVSGS